MSCKICASAELKPVFDDTLEASEWILGGVKYGYVLCKSCGFLQCDPIPDEATLLKFYQEKYPYEWFQKNEYFKKLQARHRIRKIGSYLKGHQRVLDFGCGHGFFVRALAAKGFSSFGFDIGAEKISRENNLTITHLNTLDAYTEKDFDVITAWHVLEHMRDQHAVLENLHKRIRQGGLLIIAVPNTNSYAFKLVKQKWGWSQQPYVHINQYNSTNLSQLLSHHGFQVLAASSTDTWDQNIYDLLISWLFYRHKSRNPVRSFGHSALGNFIFRMNQLVRLAFTPLSYLVSFIRAKKMEGSELIVVAKKI